MDGRRWGMPDGPAQRALKELEEQNEVKLGDAFLVRIPQIEGKISMRNTGPHQTYVDYIWESWYDQERKQMRNRKKVIGQVLESIPGAMLPNENYYRFFDRRSGELKEGTVLGSSSRGEGSVPRGQSSRYATGAYRADYPRGTPEPAPLGMPEEEEEKLMTERQEMIRNVMEEEGMIGRDSERIREEIRGIRDERGNGSFRLDGYTEKKKTRILLDLLTSMRDVVREHARKWPEDVMPLYQVEKINLVLEEIRKMEAELGFGEMLEVIPRPKTRFADGETVIEGMSYGDVEVLLECYNSVIWFTRDELIEYDKHSGEQKD